MTYNFIQRLKRIRKFLIQDRKQQIKFENFQNQFDNFKNQLPNETVFSTQPCLDDDTETTAFEPHYTYHPAWAARVLATTKPTKHVDISSIIYFGTLVSAFIPVEFYDYRPANVHLSNYTSGKTDLTNLHFESNSIESLSCMHTVEHIGLGRYGDPLDVEGDLKAMKELARVLAIGGSLIFVVPIGKPKVAFNAHRIYSYQFILDQFASLELKEFVLVPDAFEHVGYIVNPNQDITDKQHWGCGCFWFTKVDNTKI